MTCLACSTLALLGIVIGLVYLFLVWSFGYWKKRGIKEAKSYPLFGSFPSPFTQKRHFADDIEDIYREFKSSENFVGVFTSKRPQLLILNPEIGHKIFVNDFKHFHDNELSKFVDGKNDVIFGNNPFTITGELWKERRAEVTPGLTVNRIKTSYPVTLEVCERFKDYIKQQIKVPSKDGIDTIELCLRFTCEVTTDCVLGVKANTMSEEASPVLSMTKEIFEVNFKFILYQLIAGIVPGIERFYKMTLFPKNPQKFFTNLMKQAIELRQQNHSDRTDFLNYLLQLKNKKNLSTDAMVAHTMTFLVDGFFTTAMLISHCLLMLARYPKTQEKLRAEILASLKKDKTIDFEKLHEMPYLDACFHETLRLFPPLLFANKNCSLPYEFENKNGKKLQFKTNEVAIVPIRSIHLDENYYQKPQEFMPERFLGDESVKSYRDKGLFYGFGDGPRVCVGMRFALTQGKAALAEVVKNFRVTVNPKTRSDIALDPMQFIAMLKGGIHLDYELLN